MKAWFVSQDGCLVRAYERCWEMCVPHHWIWANLLSICQSFWKNNLLALIRNESRKNSLFKFKLVGIRQVENLMAISNSCLLFQQFTNTIQEDIESRYCTHVELIYPDNISRDDFKNAFGWSILYVSIMYLYKVKCWKRHLGRSDCQIY